MSKIIEIKSYETRSKISCYDPREEEKWGSQDSPWLLCDSPTPTPPSLVLPGHSDYPPLWSRSLKLNSLLRVLRTLPPELTKPVGKQLIILELLQSSTRIREGVSGPFQERWHLFREQSLCCLYDSCNFLYSKVLINLALGWDHVPELKNQSSQPVRSRPRVQYW